MIIGYERVCGDSRQTLDNSRHIEGNYEFWCCHVELTKKSKYLCYCLECAKWSSDDGRATFVELLEEIPLDCSPQEALH